MNSLRIYKGDTTPSLDFNIETMEFFMEGECRPENVLTCFEPIIKWMDSYVDWLKNKKSAGRLNFNFKLEYYNSSSAKFIFNIFKQLKVIQSNGIEVNVFWFYYLLDEDLLECGQEYEKILGLKFHFLALQE
ncbi:MAG: hypothetical protein CMP63_08160 [Flavobacteriales bacterium]|nr:hypothetical protein [Flavobacteriales bacterium]|tara:strand:- start:5519 stop:5914 length:396 start_codon:yes stop_codon:yes gene_type:complete